MTLESRLSRTALLSVSLLTVMTGAAVAPALGQISQAFPDTDTTLVKMITSVPSLVIIFASLLSGQLARVVRKRSLLIAGLAIYLIGGLGGGFADSVVVLLLFRAVLGLGVGIIAPLSLTLIADFFTGETRTRYMGYSNAVSNLGGAVTTILGGWLAAMNWRYAFGVYVLAVGVLALVAFALPEPRHMQVADLIRDRLPLGVYGLAALGFLEMLGFYVIPASGAIFMQSEGIGDAQGAGLMFAGLTLCTFLVGLVYSRIAATLHFWTPVAGVALVGGGFWTLAGSAGLAMVLLSMVLVGVGMGLVHPALLVGTANKVPQTANSVALSIFNSATYLGQFLSPVVFAALGAVIGNSSTRFSFRVSGVAFALAALAATVGLLSLRRREASV